MPNGPLKIFIFLLRSTRARHIKFQEHWQANLRDKTCQTWICHVGQLALK